MDTTLLRPFRAPLALFAAVVLLLALAVAPATATEADAPADAGDTAEAVDAEAGADEGGEGEAGGAGGEESDKIQLPSTERDRVGLILIVLMLVGGGLAVWNARKQLKGEREQASGEWRWR